MKLVMVVALWRCGDRDVVARRYRRFRPSSVTAMPAHLIYFMEKATTMDTDAEGRAAAAAAAAAAAPAAADDNEPPDGIDVFPPQSQESAAMSTLTPSQDYLDEYEMSEGLTEAELRGGGPAPAAAPAAAVAGGDGDGDASIGDLPFTQDTVPTVNLDDEDGDGPVVESSQQSSGSAALPLLDTQPPEDGDVQQQQLLQNTDTATTGGGAGRGATTRARAAVATGGPAKRTASEDHGGDGGIVGGNKRQKTAEDQEKGADSSAAQKAAGAGASSASQSTSTSTVPAVPSNSNSLRSGRTTKRSGSRSRRRGKYADRPRRRRRWTDDEGVPSFLAILTGGTPPPSDDEEELEDTARREREWTEQGRFVVDIDALIGLASPISDVVVKEESGDDDAGAAKSAPEKPAGAPIVIDEEDEDPLAEYLPPSEGGTKQEVNQKSANKSSLYRIGSDVRTRVWDAAVREGSVLPNENSSSDVIWLGDFRAADPFLAPGAGPGLFGLTPPGGTQSRSSGATAINASGLPVDVKSEMMMIPSVMPTVPKTFYEGVMPLALPDDEEYLSELHCLVRQNLELFSATDADLADKSYGKRTPIVRGKVGIRCVHCAAKAASTTTAVAAAIPDAVGSTANSPQRKMKYIGGSVSYVSSISSLANIACQKPQLHFASCPHTPSDIKERFHRLTHDEDGNPLRQRSGAVVRKLGISSTKYWLVAARRVGLVDVRSGGGGIRFARDPELPPRTAEEVTREDPSLTGPVYGVSSAAAASLAGPSLARTPPAASTSAVLPETLGHISSSVTKLKADDDSDRVLREVLAEIQACGEEKQSVPREEGVSADFPTLPFLVTSHDIHISTDYSFILASQLTIVHATQFDAMNPRGKRARSFRPGTCGFTCRNCARMVRQREASGENAGTGYGIAASSFPSTSQALCTTVTQTLMNHWQRCAFTRQEVKDAIAAYKNIHPRQVSQLPTGANGRFWLLLWNRLRKLDKDSSEMVNENSREEPILPTSMNAIAVSSPIASQALSEGTANSLFVAARSPSPSPTERPENFPTSKNDETLEILAAAKNEAFDGVLFTSLAEMMLVTDFVILILKQLSPCSSAKYRRNVGKGGVQCKHCMERSSIRYGGAASGRTFPSAPDNWASSLKESIYNHLVRCDLVPENIRAALVDLKSLHTEQMNTLKFGAQRQYLRLLHHRITEWASSKPTSDVATNAAEADDTTLERHGFYSTAAHVSWYGCVRCRMVPLDLRAKGSLSQQRPSEAFVQRHENICKGREFDLSALLGVAKQMVDAVQNPNISILFLQTPAFQEFVRSLVGDSNDLVNIFTEGVVEQSKRTVDQDQATACSKYNSEGRWNSFPSSIDVRTSKLLFENLLQEVDTETANHLRTNEHFKTYIRIVAPSLTDFSWMNNGEQEEKGNDDEKQQNSSTA